MSSSRPPPAQGGVGSALPVPSSPPRPSFRGRGVLRENELYIERPADKLLVAALLRGEHCHVLAPRQVGKSNLRLRAAKELERRRSAGGQRIRTAAVELTMIGSDASESEWYLGLIELVMRDLRLDGDAGAFWAEHAGLSEQQRFVEAMRTLVLGRTEDAIVLFMDEIDVTLSLPFSRDSFFQALLSMQGGGAELQRLTFCLIGVVTPLNLVKDSTRTPFNKSLAVDLEDFTREQAQPFRDALAAVAGNPDALFDAVFKWTHGHPALMQQICERLVREPPEPGEDEARCVHRLVESMYLRSGRTDDPILLDIEHRFTASDITSIEARRMLSPYRRILSGEYVPAEEHNSALYGDMRFAGLAAVRRDQSGRAWIQPRNAIFSAVFDLRWVDRLVHERLIFADPLTRWLLHEKSDEHVLPEAQLDRTLAWARGRQDVTPEEMEFLLASETVARMRAEQREAEQRQREEEQRQREEVQRQREADQQRLQGELHKREEERRHREAEHELALAVEKTKHDAQRRRTSLVIASSGLLLALTITGFVLIERANAAGRQSEIETQVKGVQEGLMLELEVAESRAADAESRANDAKEVARKAEETAERAERDKRTALDIAQGAGQSAAEARRAASRAKKDADEKETQAQEAKRQAEVQHQAVEWAKSLVTDASAARRTLTETIIAKGQCDAELESTKKALQSEHGSLVALGQQAEAARLKVDDDEVLLANCLRRCPELGKPR